MSFARTEREQVLTGETTAAAASTYKSHGALSAINGVPLDEFELIIMTIVPTVGSTGGTWTPYVLFPVKANPNVATAGDWSDWFAFAAQGAGSTTNQFVIAPIYPGPAAQDTTPIAKNPQDAGIAANTQTWFGAVPEQIKLVTRTGAGVTVAATFNVHLTGFRRAWK